VARGWVDDQPKLGLPQLFELFTKAEIIDQLGEYLEHTNGRKSDWLEALLPHFPDAVYLEDWLHSSDDTLYALTIQPLCDRLRLLFFGNLHQGWTEFVLSELGIFRYESVELTAASSAFRHAGDVDHYLQLADCHERFEAAEPIPALLQAIPLSDNSWLETRRAKLLFRIAQHCERSGDLAQAQALYATIDYPGARTRHIRVLERTESFAAALALAESAERDPESAEEAQHLQRILPRLRRRLGLPKLPPTEPLPIERLDLELTPPADGTPVEYAVLGYLSAPTSPVHYVENSLLNSLFGLLCWDAVFAPLPGAFFHPFQSGPADLHDPDFYRRRAQRFDSCLAQLNSGAYRDTIRRNYVAKQGVLSPFVYWGALDETLLELALACIPATHLQRWCEWLLRDIRANRAGLPDLIQFWPEERRYRMIEVKGPGDRLQDNQRRWLAYCAAHDMPVMVCHVRWGDRAT
jgi:hypothetical protein